MKSILSLVIIGLFLLAAMSSFGPDKSTNTTVAISNCQEKPPINANFKVFIHYTATGGGQYDGISGDLFLTQQEVTNSDSCIYKSFTYSQYITLDAAGSYETVGTFYTAKNSEDLWRVELNVAKTAFFTECREVKVAKYPTSSVTINCVVKRLDAL